MRYANVNGIWKNSIQYTNVNGTWKRVKDIQANVRGVWKSTIPPVGTFLEGGYVAGVIDTLDIEGGGERYLLLVSPKANQVNLPWSIQNGIGGAASSKWNGLENTQKLATTQFPAAKYCYDAVINNYNDWYLPAVDELELVYRNLKPTSLINEMNFNNDRTTRSKSFAYPTQYHGYNPSSDPIGEAYYNVQGAAITWSAQYDTPPIAPLPGKRWPYYATTVGSPNKTTVPIFQENQSESFWPPLSPMNMRFAYSTSTYYSTYYTFRTFFYTVNCGNEWAKSGGQYKEQYGLNTDLHYVRPVRRILI